MELPFASTYITPSTTSGLNEYFLPSPVGYVQATSQLADVRSIDLLERGILSGIGAAGVIAPGRVSLRRGQRHEADEMQDLHSPPTH